jgi:hypothetical protein
MEIKPIYITFEQATLLKDKKFSMNIKSNLYRTESAIYKENEKLVTNQDTKWGTISMFDGIYAALEQWQVVEWLRVTHGIWISVAPRFYSDGSLWYVYECLVLSKNTMETLNNNLFQGVFEMYNSPQEAYSVAFDYVLNNLI